jgi:SAM-dependent methyltransferase
VMAPIERSSVSTMVCPVVDEIDGRCSITAAADLTLRPSVARVYDFLLGGVQNFPADRAVAQQVLAHMPGLPAILRANRDFMRRVVGWLARAGIRQFLDLGCGIPTPAGNVHQVAQQIDPSARVAYVDVDPVAVITAEQILTGIPNVCVAHADLRDPAGLLGHPQVCQLIDSAQPVAVLLLSVLHLIPDPQRPDLIIRELHRCLAGGSYLALSHMSPPERQGPPGAREAAGVHAGSGNAFHPRTLPQLEDLLGNWQLLPPGLVACSHWRPDRQTPPLDLAMTFPGYAGLCQKPTPPRQRDPDRRATMSSSAQGASSRPRPPGHGRF